MYWGMRLTIINVLDKETCCDMCIGKWEVYTAVNYVFYELFSNEYDILWHSCHWRTSIATYDMSLLCTMII